MYEIEKRGMGYTFDEDRAQLEAANGLLGGRSETPLDMTNGMADDAMRIETAGSQLRAELQEIRMLLAYVAMDPPSEERLVTWSILSADEQRLSTWADGIEVTSQNPLDTQRVGEWLDAADAAVFAYMTNQMFEEIVETATIPTLPAETMQHLSASLHTVKQQATEGRNPGVAKIAATVEELAEVAAHVPGSETAALPKDLALTLTH